MIALLWRQHNVVRLLVKRGANVNHRMKHATNLGHETPMDVAIWVAKHSKKMSVDKSMFTVELLLKHGAVVDPSGLNI